MEIASKFAGGRLAKGRPMRKKGWLPAILFYFNLYALPFSYITHLQVYLYLQAFEHIQISSGAQVKFHFLNVWPNPS